MRKSRLPAGGANLFQAIKKKCLEAEAEGVKVWRLTVGQPTGPALLSARQAAADAVISSKESMHEYQDNGSPGVYDFAKRFVAAHLPEAIAEKIADHNDIKYLPTPGTKPMLGLIIQACGQIGETKISVSTMTSPGYPTPATQACYLGADHHVLVINPENDFLFSMDDSAFAPDLIMANYPHNPTGQIATKEFWLKLCKYCSDYDIRLFNDAAYAILAHTADACTLAEVAVDFPSLSWAEAFSASKVIANGTGWRVGAIVGSYDFIDDISTIKGNTDSGFVAFAAAGVIKCMENDMPSIAVNRAVFGNRINILRDILERRGMRLAAEPRAGFFTLWLTPKRAFGQEIEDATQFNELMIKNTGVAGVPFGRYIRYAVTSPIENDDWTTAIVKAFDMAEIDR